MLELCSKKYANDDSPFVTAISRMHKDCHIRYIYCSDLLFDTGECGLDNEVHLVIQAIFTVFHEHKIDMAHPKKSPE